MKIKDNFIGLSACILRHKIKVPSPAGYWAIRHINK